jgi:hypothetical protein
MRRITEAFFSLPSHSFLLAFSPVLGLYSTNIREVSYSEITKPLLIAGTVVLVTYVVTYFICHRLHKLDFAEIITMSLVLLIIFPYLKHHIVLLTIVSITYSLLVLGFFVRRIKVKAISPYLNLMALIVLLPSLIIISLNTQFIGGSIPELPPVYLQSDNKPDIYYILLDGYGREDQLQKHYDFDNSAFLTELEARGFTVADNSNTNYGSTECSLYSSLNQDFVPKARNYSLIDQSIQASVTARSLKGIGYTYIKLGSWWYVTNHSSYADENYNWLKTQGFQSMVLEQTSVWSVIDYYGKASSRNISLQENTARKWNQLNEIACREPGSKFVFAHFLTTHPPFTVATNGAPITSSIDYGNENYENAILYTNSQVLKWLDNVPENAVVILQADHGAYPDNSQAEWNSEDWQERYGIFVAAKNIETSDDISPVNIFRTTFNQIFSTDLELLPNDSYWWAPNKEPMDLSARLSS